MKTTEIMESREKPIRDAADEVAKTAAYARALLCELRAGWLWKLLTRPPKP